MKREAFFAPAAVIVAIICLVLFTAREGLAKGVAAELDLGVGYRTDDFDWNIAGDLSGRNPTVLSELTWSDLEILQVKASFKASARRVYARGSLGYGWILEGKNQDSDYIGDNRTLEFSRSNNDAGEGRVLDASIGLGYKVIDEKLMVAPIIGYSYHTQELKLRYGFQTIPPLGAFSGLDSSYDADWDGPWVGMDASLSTSERFNIFASFEYHWADYSAVANWNLRTDLARPVSFVHWADGEGIIISAGAAFSPKGNWSLHVSGEYMDWQTDPGADRIFFANGNQADTRLNEVNWRSMAVMLETAYRFH